MDGSRDPAQDGSVHRGDRDSPEETPWDELLLWQWVSQAPREKGAEAVQVSEHRSRGSQASVAVPVPAGHSWARLAGSWPWLLLWRHSGARDRGRWEACRRARGSPERRAQPALTACSWPSGLPNPLSPKRLLPAWEEPFQLWLFSFCFILTVPVQISC